MEPFVLHLDPIRRHFPHSLPVNTIGYVPRKTDRVDRIFQTFNVSFILSGEGDYTCGDCSWRVVSPCVITQWPGLPVAYGPRDRWEELYLIYNPEHLSALCERHFADSRKPIWYLQDGSALRDGVEELAVLRSRIHSYGTADQIDCLASRMILDSLIGESDPRMGPRERHIRRIRATVERDFRQDHDFGVLAREAGFSLPTFRRLWNDIVGVPPHQFILRRRIQEASRLLVETGMSMGEIAVSVGFRDRLYFSRRFRQTTGLTATQYRRTFRSLLPTARHEPEESLERRGQDSSARAAIATA